MDDPKGISLFSPSYFRNAILSIPSCDIPDGAASYSSTSNLEYASLYLIIQASILAKHVTSKAPFQNLTVIVLSEPIAGSHSTQRIGISIPVPILSQIPTRLDSFLIPIQLGSRIKSGGLFLRELSPGTVYSLYAALHYVPHLIKNEKVKATNLLEKYFAALRPDMRTSSLKAVEHLIDPGTAQSSTLRFVTLAKAKHRFQFAFAAPDANNKLIFQHVLDFPGFHRAVRCIFQAHLILPQHSLDSTTITTIIEICLLFSTESRTDSTQPSQHCLYLNEGHLGDYQRKNHPESDGTFLYPVDIDAAWPDTQTSLHRIVVTFKCDGNSGDPILIRPQGMYLLRDSPGSSPASPDPPLSVPLTQEHALGAPSSEEPALSDPDTTPGRISPVHVIATPASLHQPSSIPKIQEHAIGAPSISDTTPGQVSPAGGSTVPAPDPHDTRDPTVSPVQPRSRGMGSLRAVVGALGAGRRSTSVVAAAVVRRGMPRPGRAGAWGTGRAALLVLGVVCGVALLLAAVVLVLVRMRRNSKNQIEPVSPSDGSNSLRKAFLDNKRSEVMNVNSERSIICMVDVG